MLPRVAFSIAASLLTVTASCQEHEVVPRMTCMTATYVTKQAKNKNTFTLCRGANHATQEVHFPNRPLYEPTTCRSVGTVDDSDGQGSTYRFSEGSCENGKTLRPAEFVCDSLKRKLSCTYEGVQLDFSPVEMRP